MDQQTAETLLRSLGLIALAVILGYGAARVLFVVIKRITHQTPSPLDDYLPQYCRQPFEVIIPLALLHIILPLVGLSPHFLAFCSHTLSLAIIGAFAWLCIRLIAMLEAMILSRYKMDVEDNLKARKIHTQLLVLKRILVVIICVVAFAAMLMTFEKVRQLGTSILASAGIAGIIIGVAAQRTLSTLLAGLQIAITQPIRLDDVVIVENEWGRIEEITLTYVVVRIWDLRRLVLPITYFTEKPFQNWTRVSSDILGTVYLYTDYTVPVHELRAELHRLLQASDLWDKKVWGLQVTNATERTMELRALMSAPDASAAWNLRCELREKLIDFVRKNYPEALPKVRAEINPTAAGEIP